jgi:hypothetical protein
MSEEFLNDWFTLLTVIGIGLGFTNLNKNKVQESKQEELSKKIDRILFLLEKNGEEKSNDN